MLFIDVFNDYARLFATGSIFLFLAVATFYAGRLKAGIGLKLLFAGLTVIFLTALLQHFAGYLYAKAVSAKILTLTEMLLVLSSSILLIMASSRILVGEPLNINIIFGFITIGLVVTLYAIFIADDANIIDNIRQILPIIGMSYVFLSFVSRPKVWKFAGNLTAGVMMAGFVMLMTMPLFSSRSYAWFWPLILMTGLGFSYFLMMIDDLNNKLTQAAESNSRMVRNIQNVVKSSPFPIIISRLSDDVVVMANNNALKMFGMVADELARYHLKDFFADPKSRQRLSERLEKGQAVYDFEILVKTASGNTPFWLLASVNVIDYDNGIVLYSAFQDITSRKQRETVLQSQADRDPLTSIFNRRYFEDKGAEKIEEAHRKNESFAVLMIDADHFKTVNDTYGHKIGDKVLIELASVCEHTLRSDDLIARYGGEEFVAFLRNVDAQTAPLVANRLREAVAESVVYAEDDQPVRFTVSVGVALSGVSDNIGVMLKMADDAMYAAKQNGRNRVVIYDEKLRSDSKPDIQRENQLHPVFLNEENEEISLLDGVAANRIGEN